MLQGFLTPAWHRRKSQVKIVVSARVQGIDAERRFGTLSRRGSTTRLQSINKAMEILERYYSPR